MVRNFKLCSFCLCGNETCADATGRFNRPNASSTPAEYLLTHATCKSCLNWYDFSHMYFKRHALSLQLFLLTSSSTNMDSNDDNSTTGDGNHLRNAAIRGELTLLGTTCSVCDRIRDNDTNQLLMR